MPNFKPKTNKIKLNLNDEPRIVEINLEANNWGYLNDNIKIKSNSNSTITGNNNYTGVSNRQTSSYTKYVEFQFDDGDKVAYWRSKGINKSWNNHSEILSGLWPYHGGFMFFIGTLIDCTIALTIAFNSDY